MLPDSLLSGDNAAYLDGQYRAWQVDPGSVDPQIRALFDGLEPMADVLPTPALRSRSIFDPGGSASVDAAASGRLAKVVQLINAYRVRGHMQADIDPLRRREKQLHPELTLAHHGLGPDDLAAEVPTAPLYGMPPRATIGAIVEHLRQAYCGSIGAEFMNIQDNAEKLWVQEQLETLPSRAVLAPEEELRILRKLSIAESFEQMLHTRFPGTKRFSLEGAETLVPLLDLLVTRAASHGCREIVVGMAHRGRLNTLVNILEKPARLVVGEFEGVGGTTQGSGDVKYHKGYSADVVTVHGDPIHLSLTPNPSHLEAVDPVVQGRVRAKQDRAGDTEHQRCMAVLVHGDAAFSGQGLVMEVLNLSELHGYRTGGTVHVIVNNQIGFTTPPAESRSTPYATDIARMLAIPIFHVNGEDPRAVAAVVQTALAWRMRFNRDVVIDMYCYRKHGHNEGDEPSFTQPKMYEVIRARPTPRHVYAEHLQRIGTLTEADCARILQEARDEMQQAADLAGEQASSAASVRAEEMKGEDPDLALYVKQEGPRTSAGQRVADDAISPFKGLWQRYSGTDIREEVDAHVALDDLVALLQQLNQIPDGFAAHAKIKRLFAQRRAMANGERPLDWAVAEQAAFGSLLQAGHPVRLSGQDCGRGTFSHRHAVITDVESGDEHYPLAHLGERFCAIDSSLSEAGVLGFEVGYAFDTPEGLVLWEAQFGDFANGAQIIIDQFIVASEQKWDRRSGLVLLLPHGYEGQGPEHSSARMERFLAMCADDNIQVGNLTTPAQYYHCLRRQVLRSVRCPLVLMTPKSLLRHPGAVSSLDELASGRFESVIADDESEIDADEVQRVVFCSGKVYYELLAERRARGERRIALHRLELVYPFPHAEVAAAVSRYPEAAELVWCQEEPKNMGAWPSVLQWTVDEPPAGKLPGYVGRPAAASPATGSNKKHREEQAALVRAALTLD